MISLDRYGKETIFGIIGTDHGPPIIRSYITPEQVSQINGKRYSRNQIQFLAPIDNTHTTVNLGNSLRFVPILLVVGLSLFEVNSISGLLSTRANVAGSGTISIPSSLSIGIFSDSACTTPITTFSWGDLQPGGASSKVIYIKNTGNVAATLHMSVGTWAPSTASNYLTVTWDKESASIAANQVIQATLTLTVSSSITGITSYSMSINIDATQS